MKKQVKVENDTYGYSYEYEYDDKKNNDKKPKTPLTHRTGAKVFAFILAVIMSLVISASILMAVYMIDEGMYINSKDQYIEDEYYGLVIEDLEEIAWYVDYNTAQVVQEYCKEYKNIKSLIFTDDKGKKKFSYQAEDDAPAYEYSFYDYLFYDDELYGVEPSELTNAVVCVYKEPIDYDYVVADGFIDFCYSILYKVYPIAIIGLILIIICVVFLLSASGHKKGYDEIKLGWGTKFPFDLLTVVTGIAIFFSIWLLVTLVDEFVPTINIFATLIFGSLMVPVIMFFLLGWLMSFALRIKLGKWWENTVIYRIIVLLIKLGKIILKQIKKGVRFLSNLFLSIPLVWKTALILLAIILVKFIIMICTWWEPDNQLIWFCISSIVLGTAVIYCAVVIKKLQQANQEIANGNFDYRVDTGKMFGDFKKHGEAINSIAEGMNLAVAKQLKSERMKTELITNVSHDIKTPLTSIINYTDLIEKEPCENEKIKEYSKVLLRQSNKLKRLIDDLVEVSKASTGNMEVNLSGCDANIFVDQVAGEYQEKLQERNIELITIIPENPIKIMADGRRLWRIFDNLINNVYKYALSNTRVYLSLEEQKGEAVITLKNISQSPLNITEEELMERFVRGDSSRNTEGNGLGLSIARSLTELQKGTFEIAIDGDLFKAILKFPIEG